MWQLFGKFMWDVAVGVTVAGISSYLFDPSPTIISPSYNSYYSTPSSGRSVQINNSFSIAPPPPDFNKDSAVLAYARQFEQVNLPATPEDFIAIKNYTGGTQTQGASLKIIEAHFESDRITFAYRLILTEQAFEGKGFYVPKTGDINLGLEAHGIKPGGFGKFRHVRTGITTNFIYFPLGSGKDKLQLIDNGKP